MRRLVARFEEYMFTFLSDGHGACSVWYVAVCFAHVVLDEQFLVEATAIGTSVLCGCVDLNLTRFTCSLHT